MSGSLIFESKQSAEVKPYFYDYTGGLPDGESLVTAAVTVTEFATPFTDVTSAMLNSSTVVSPRVNIVLQAGTSGTRYKIRYLMTTTSGYTLEGDAYIDVKDI